MKKNYLLLILLFVLNKGISQNLVPNGGFEQYYACPSYWGQIDSALFWINPTNGTPDYFNACSTFNNTGVPSTGMGNRPAHNGVAFSGIALYDASGINKREYIETPFTAPLIANMIYHFEMFSSIGYYAQYTTDAIQVYFSDTLIKNSNSISLLPYVPQISNDSGAFISISTAPWSLISGDYTAHGGESYLIIGNFKNDSSTTLLNSGSVFNTAYSYIDDVSLSVLTGIKNPTEVVDISIYPNPFSNYIFINTNNMDNYQITILDIYSAKILQTTFTNTISLNTNQFESGIYLYEIRNDKGTCKKGKILKN